MTTPPRLYTLLTVLLCMAAQGASTASLEQQRKSFQAAREAAAQGHWERFDTLRKGLSDYPLYGYLRYDYLRKHLDQTPPARIRGFLDYYKGLPVSGSLRSAWLRYLAKQQHWKTFLEFYREPQPTTLQCLRLRARLALTPGSRPSKALLGDIKKMWLAPRSLPSQCDPAFAALKKAGGIDRDLVWQRIRLAMQKRQTGLVKYLKRSLADAQDRRWVDRWLAVHQHPKDTLSTATWHGQAPVAKEITVHGLRRLANIDAGEAMALWRTLAKHYTFTEQQRADLENYIATRTATQRRPQAGIWLAGLAHPDESARNWRVRNALLRGDWNEVLEAGRALPADERETDHWRYWRARALEALGLPGADAMYKDLAGRRGYHSFLAADRTGRPYEMGDRPLQPDPATLRKVAARPGLIRARELYHTGYITDARREWQRTTRGMTKQQLKAAAKLADDWGWHDRAIFTVARAKDFDDMRLRFPIAYRTDVFEQARGNAIDPSWVYGILRQESAFMVDAHSPAGARGLMQLMPATGRRTAKLIQSPLRRLDELVRADRNIQLGSAYLKQVLDRNNGHLVLATASYNAGPHRVERWLPEGEPLEADIWAENIPFKETRTYVRRVLAYSTIYDWRLQRPVRPLRLRMPAVAPKPGKE